MSRIEAPCYKNGVDCPKRKIGCRSQCEAWHEYEDAVEQDRALKIKRYNESNDVKTILCNKQSSGIKGRGGVGERFVPAAVADTSGEKTNQQNCPFRTVRSCS